MQKLYPSSGRKAWQRRLLITLVGTLALIMALQGFINSQLIAKAATAPTLGTFINFALLAGSTVTNTGSSVISGGNLGVSPGSMVSGFPPGTVMLPGTIQAGNAVALQAQNDVTIAYNNLAGQTCSSDLTGTDLGGLTLLPGVYCFPSTSALLTGTLTLDAAGNPNAVFIIQIGSTLTTASDSVVRLIGGLSPCNVFWQIGSSATLGARTSFTGNLMALTSISLTTNASILGRAVARTAAVTLDTNNITSPNCVLATPTATSTSTATPTATPTSTATPTPNPTSTALPPATSTPAPTAAPAATSRPTSVPTLTLTPAMTITPSGTITPSVTALATTTATTVAGGGPEITPNTGVTPSSSATPRAGTTTPANSSLPGFPNTGQKSEASGPSGWLVLLGIALLVLGIGLVGLDRVKRSRN